MNTIKVHIRDKLHYQSEWSEAVKKGYTLDCGSTDLLWFTPESIVYHLAEKVATPLQRDFIDTGSGKIYYFEDAKIEKGIAYVRSKRKRDANKSKVVVSRSFEDIKDAVKWISEVTGNNPKLPKVYRAVKYGLKYYNFDIKFKRKAMDYKKYCDQDSLQLTLPFTSND